MASCANPAARGNFTFGQTVAGFLVSPGLPFVDIMSEKLVARVFAKHHGLFGRTYTTAIVLWAFMSQVLRDGKEASCQSAAARISSYLNANDLGDVDCFGRSLAASAKVLWRWLIGSTCSTERRKKCQNYFNA